MIISVVGTGYVGLVTGVCLASLGHKVTCIDVDEFKINRLNKGIIPIYEPGLEELIKEYKDNLTFTTSYEPLSKSKVTFIAVGTPPMEDGSADLKYIRQVATEFGKNINEYSIIVTKSTVPVGTSDIVKEIVSEELRKRNAEINFDVVSNPEFLQEGSAINDFRNPERIVIGIERTEAAMVMSEVYDNYKDKLLITDVKSSEMIKYASNSMLATRISFMNELARLCEVVGADIKTVAKGMGFDSRIGKKFLHAGCGYGGSCFPKDVKALIKTGDENNVNLSILRIVDNVNNEQKHILYKKLSKVSKEVEYRIKNITILGLAFKPNTDDVREAPSIQLINDINNDNELDVNIKVWDPIAIDNTRRALSKYEYKNIQYISNLNIYDAINESDVVIICTEWKEIKDVSLQIVKKIMEHNIIIDGRNIFDKSEMKYNGFNYICI